MSATPLESTLERKCNTYATRVGFLSRKMNGMGNRSWPDRLYIGPRGTVFFVEYKRAGERPTAMQEFMHITLRSAGLSCFVIDEFEEARAVFDAMAKKCGGETAMQRWRKQLRQRFMGDPKLVSMLKKHLREGIEDAD